MEKIFVSIRVRPLSKVESTKGSPWKLGPNSIILCNSTGAPVSGQSYKFDRVFGSESSTLEIYETHTKDIIASAVRGFNGTVFAYGQTSSGKTYTMRGSSHEPGIIPLAVQEIFRNIQEAEDREFLLRVSYMEIYNEEINDLLAPENRKLQVHENFERGIFVAGLREEIVVSPEQVLDLMTAGETYRHVGETNMNTYSSRSHSIFRMVIESRDRSHDDPNGPTTVQSCDDAVRVSVLNLVDLAGSERVAKTGAEGTRLKEGTHINKSLMTLGTVINKLSEGVEKQGGHVPYRDSKLTRILQPALGGNAKTAVICNITPAQIHVDETKGTLFFASRANRVTNCAQVNEIMTDAALLKRQKKEIEVLRNKLQENHSDHWDAEILNLRNALLKTELERERMALELQQEKKAQAERERLLKEQEQKIENLSTMVINSAVDNRDLDKRNKKNNRRETWCPRLPSIETNEKPQESKRPFPKQSPLARSMLSTRRDRLPPLPPPFENLIEGEDIVSPVLESDENTFGEEFQSFPSADSNLDSIFQEPPPVFFCERKRRSPEKSVDDDLRQQLGDLQVQYDDSQLEHQLKMREKMLEMEELKKELAFAQSAANKARKLGNTACQAENRRVRSLDGWESDTTVDQLRAQIQNLEMEKMYMQKEIDTLKALSSIQASPAIANLKKVDSMESIELEMEGARITWDREVQNQKESNEATSGDLLALVEECNLLRSSLLSLEEEREVLKEQNYQAETELKELDVEVQRQRQEIDAAERALDIAKDESMRAAEIIEELRETVSQKSDENVLLQTKIEDLFVKASSLEDNLEKKVRELEYAKKREDTLTLELRGGQQQLPNLEMLLLEKDEKIKVLSKDLVNLEVEFSGMREDINNKVTELEQLIQLTSTERANLEEKNETALVHLQKVEEERDELLIVIQDLKEESKQLKQLLRDEEFYSGDAPLKISSASTLVSELQDILAKKNAELEQVEREKNEDIMIRAGQQQLASLEIRLLEKDEKIEVLTKDPVELEVEYSGMREDINNKVAEMEQLVLLRSTERAVLEEQNETAIFHLRHVEVERDELRIAIQELKEESNQLKQLLQDEESQSGDAQLKMSSANNLIIELQNLLAKKNVELEQQLERVKNVDTLSLELTGAQQQVAGLELLLLEKDGKIDALSKDLVNLEVEYSGMREDINNKVAEMEQLVQLNSTERVILEERNEAAVVRLHKIEVEREELLLVIQELKEESNQLKQLLQDKESQSGDAQSKMSSANSVIIELQDLLAKKNVELEQQLEREKDVDTLSLELTGAQQRVAGLDLVLLEKDEKIEVLTKDLVKLEVEYSGMREDIDNKVAEMEQLVQLTSTERADLEEKSEATVVHLRNVQVERDELRMLIQELKEESNQLKQLLRDEESRSGDSQSKISSANSLIIELQDLLLKKNAELEQVVQRVAGLELLLLEKDENIKVLSKDLVNLEVEYSGIREDINKKVAEMEQLVQLTNTERAVLEEKNEVAVVHVRSVEIERDELRMVIQELKEESNQFKHLLQEEESQSGDAQLKISSANSLIIKLQDIIAKKNAELEQVELEKNQLVDRMTATEHSLREELEKTMEDLSAQKTAEIEQVVQENKTFADRMSATEQLLREELERKSQELHFLVAQKTAELVEVEQEKSGLFERLAAVEHSLREEFERKIQELLATVSNLEGVNLEVHEKVKQVESHLSQAIEAKERLLMEKEALLDATVQLQDRISCLQQEDEQHQVELKQMESKLASANFEIDDTGNQLNDVHALLTENQKERLVLQHSLEELENDMAGLQKRSSIKDAELASASEALSEIKTKFEAFQKLHNTESTQFKSDILGLRKELKAAKAAPGSLEKERDGLRKDLEKLKTKLGDIEAKLKSTLIEKSKVETEKLNIEREVKQLRQSTALLNKRESIVDKRRESVACGLNKTKLQLSSTEHALQMKNNELEKTAFDLQLLQDNYTKLEADMVETENTSSTLKEKLAKAESAISVLRDEKESASRTIEKLTQELEGELELRRATATQLDALQSEHTTMGEKLTTFHVASEKAEAEIRSISLERDDLARQLTDTHFEFEEEKAAWAAQVDQSDAKIQEHQQQIVNLTEELQKIQKAQEEIVAARNTLQEQLDEAERTATAACAALQDQVSKLEQCLESSGQESVQLRQQVELLNSSAEEQVELQRKLGEEMLAGRDQYKALDKELEKHKELLVLSEAAVQKESQAREDLVEEIKQLNRMLQEVEQKFADLYERNLDSEAAVKKESDERMQLLEERRALVETVQSQADRCMLLEGQIFQLEANLKEGSKDIPRLLLEIQQLKEQLENNVEFSVRVQNESEANRRALELEAARNNDREVAKKQVEKLQSQLKMSNAEIESLQTELDDVSMKVKSLHLEVEDMQAALDQSRTEKSTLKQQLTDMSARFSILEDKNEQLQKKESHLLQLSKAYLTSKTKLQVALDATGSRLEYFQSLCEKMEEAIQELDEHKTVARRENDGLLVKLQNLRSRCQRYEEELREAKSQRTYAEEQERENQIAEIMQQNSALQLRLQKAEEIAKARQEETTRLHDLEQNKDESAAKLEASLESAEGQVLKLGREFDLKNEPQTVRKIDGSTMSSGEFTTPMASRQGQDDVNHTDDTTILFSNSLASRSKVEQLKLQSQSLLRMYKQPWRIRGSPGGSMDGTDDHPPPSTTLHSHHENLTAPIPTWKKAKTVGPTSNSDFLQPSNSAFSEDKLRASAFSTRSVPRAALVPVTQNKLQALGLERRLQDSGIQEKLPAQGIDEAESRPSVSSSQMPRNFRFNQRFEKENL